MKTQLTKKRKGFSLIDLLVLAVVAGILLTVFVPIAIGTLKMKTDSQVMEDLNNVGLVINKEYGQMMYSNVTIPDTTITSSSDTVFNKYIEVSDGTTIIVDGSDAPGQYILYGINEDGDFAGDNDGIIYKSVATPLNNDRW